MQILNVLRRALLPLVCLTCGPLNAQTTVAGKTPLQANRIAGQTDYGPIKRLSGHLPQWVKAQNDDGPVADATPLRVTLLLSRTPALQASFERLLADQQTPGSARYQQWLTPQQVGEQFGPSAEDVTALAQWLAAQGLEVKPVSPSRIFIEATAPAGVIGRAFATDFHRFQVDGESRIAATSEPGLPAAIADVVATIEGMAELPLHPLHHTRVVELPQPANPGLRPGYSTSNNTLHYLFPGDFLAIYDIDPVFNNGYDGTGIKVAIMGQTRIASVDVTELQGIAGMTAKAPNTIVVPDTTDPGTLQNGDQEESTLDVDRVLNTAPGVQADLVIASSATGGVGAALQYNVNTLLDPVMSLSYGECEAQAAASSLRFYDSLFAQAASEGISTFVSSGDSAAAGCSNARAAPTGSEMRAVGNYLCSSSYVTCVGGTEFIDPTPATYWSATNSSVGSSAIGYIPEGAWNEPTTTSSTGATVYQVIGTGSGASVFIPKPVWQTGVGVPADGARDLPDVSFSAADHDGYFACVDFKTKGCVNGYGLIFSGTSASAPGMAAIAGLLNQRLGKAQGNINPLLYRLAATVPTAFHDATPASSGVATCTTATASVCNNSVAGPASLTGGLAGYPLQVGYDLVTGLGSLDVYNFLVAAAALATGLSVSASPATLTLSSAALNTSATTLTVATTDNFTGSVALACSVTGTGTVPPTCSLSSASVGFAAAMSGTSTLTLSTITPHHRSGTTNASLPPWLGRVSLAGWLLVLIPLAQRRKLRQSGVLCGLLLSAALITLAGCGSGSRSSTPAPTPTPAPLTGTTPGNYTVTVTATSAAVIATSTVAVTVN